MQLDTFTVTNEEFQFKAMPGQFNIDEAKGIVECFVAAIGNKDSVGDIIISGAFDESLKRRKPRVVWGHDWNSPIGKVLEIYEVAPNDPRLPMKMKRAGVGGLYAKLQFNLKSERGREAFASVVFFGEEQEFCVTPDTEILTTRGWLTYDEVTTDDQAYVIDPETLQGRFEPILAVNIWPEKTRTLREIQVGNFSSKSTLNHRWLVIEDGESSWVTTSDLRAGHQIPAIVDDMIELVKIDEGVEAEHTGIVWCPTTPSGTWLARRDGTVYFTGNSIGYKTLDADYDHSRQANLLKAVELYEVSPVLHGANQLTAAISIKSEKQEDDRVTSFKKSKWPMFDRRFAEMVKQEYPEIWDKGGNIKGDDQYEILTRIAEQGGVAKTPDQISALELREAWVARHAANFQLPGVIAQIKWLAVGSRGEDHMKDVVREAIDKLETRKKSLNDDVEEKGYGHGPKPMIPDRNRRLAEAIGAQLDLDGKIRLRSVERNLVVFDHMDEDGDMNTWRLSYHYEDEEDEFMFGKPEKVKPTTVYMDEDDDQGFGVQAVKGPQDALLDLPQEAITGDVLRGRGPRRGNLERLLRYWRPIMKQPGGFRRCRRILANHPELYPLERICAWLHHETTGLWPNEGCHHPGMKNCRKKMRGVRNGSIWSDAQFGRRISRGKGLDPMEMDEDYEVTEDDEKYAMKVLAQFMDDEKDFIDYLRDDANWVHVGDDDDDEEVEHDWVPGEDDAPRSARFAKPGGGCGCGCKGNCGDMKSDPFDDVMEKAGRVLSSRNMAKLEQAIGLLREIANQNEPVQVKTAADDDCGCYPVNGVIEVSVEEAFGLKQFLDPVLEFHDIDTVVTESGIVIKSEMSEEAEQALFRAVEGFNDLHHKSAA